MAIKRRQDSPGPKLHSKFLGPYRAVKVLENKSYIAQREGEYEGPRTTSTAADHMKCDHMNCSITMQRGTTGPWRQAAFSYLV